MSSESELAVYLAARFSRKNEIKQKSLELDALGVKVTSRWLDEADHGGQLDSSSDEFNTAVAYQDIEDIDKSDLIVLFSENPKEPHVRGGRHFESGYAHGKGIPLIICGPKENVFHFMKEVIIVDTWEEVKANLKFLKQIKTYPEKQQGVC